MLARLAIPTLFVLLFTSASQASQVLWGSARLATNYLSSGAPASLDSGFTFQLGAFDPGFTPTASNTAEWLAHWTPAQSSQYNDRTRFFTGSYVYQDNPSPFLPNNQGYIFGFNRWAASEGSDRAEWILATDPNWRWPTGGGISPPAQWSMSNASTVVLGSINPPTKTFHMMTADIAAPESVLTFDLWSKRYFGGGEAASLTADPDNDGLSNAMEFAFSTNPLRADEGRYPKSELIHEGGESFLEIEMLKLGLAADTTLGAEVSTDLVIWEPADAAVEIVEDSFLIYRVRAIESVIPGQKRFYRLTVSLNL